MIAINDVMCQTYYFSYSPFWVRKIIVEKERSHSVTMPENICIVNNYNFSTYSQHTRRIYVSLLVGPCVWSNTQVLPNLEVESNDGQVNSVLSYHNIKVVKSPHTHVYTTIFELIRPFDHSCNKR